MVPNLTQISTPDRTHARNRDAKDTETKPNARKVPNLNCNFSGETATAHGMYMYSADTRTVNRPTQDPTNPNQHCTHTYCSLRSSDFYRALRSLFPVRYTARLLFGNPTACAGET